MVPTKTDQVPLLQMTKISGLRLVCVGMMEEKVIIFIVARKVIRHCFTSNSVVVVTVCCNNTEVTLFACLLSSFCKVPKIDVL